GHAFCTQTLDKRRQVVELFASELGCSAFGIQSAHLAAAFDSRAENLELGLRRQVTYIDDSQAVAKVRLIGPVAKHGVGIFHAWQRQRDCHAETAAENLRSQSLDHLKYIVHVYERHFQVELGELRLSIGALVLVAQAVGDLEVLVVAGDHQKLLVK